MKVILKLAILLLLFAGSACSSTEEEASSIKEVKGFVADKRVTESTRHQILVIPEINKEDLTGKTYMEIVSLSEKHDGAYYDITPEKFESVPFGSSVIVYDDSNGQEDSNPPQRSSAKVEVLDEG